MILIISGNNIISGAEYVLSDYLKAADKNKFVVLTSEIKEVINFYENLKVNKVMSSIYVTPSGASNNKIIGKVKKIYRYMLSKVLIEKSIKKYQIEKVLANNTTDIIYSAWVKKVPGMTYYQYIHDIIHKESFIGKVIKKFDENVDKYFAVSKAVKDSLCSIGIDENKIVIIYNGLSELDYQIKNKKDKMVFGFLGALNERKSPLTFADFIEKSGYKGIMAYHMCEGDMENKVKERIKKKNLDIKLIGKVERENIKKFYDSLDFLFVPSKHDPLPTVVLEAFNYSIPVVGRSIDGLPEMIIEDSNGYLFKDEQDFYRVISKIKNISNEKYRIMCRNANDTIKDNFSLHKKICQLNKFLLE